MGRKPVVNKGELLQIENFIKENPHSSAEDVRSQLKLCVSKSTVLRYINRLHWVSTKTSYCAEISGINISKRWHYAVGAFIRNEQFNDVIFVDETTVCRGQRGRFYLRKLGQPKPRIGRYKHDLKLHVFAGISKKGATDVCIFSGNLNAESYVWILKNFLLPFGTINFHKGFRLYQDNDPKHKSAVVTDFINGK